MPRQLVRFYQRSRLLNINLNLVLAGFIAIALAKFPIKFISEWLGPEHKALITLIAYGIDTMFDVAVYFGLHWIANHWKPSSVHGKGPKPERPAHRKNFLKDAGRVQAERMVLVPVFAAVSMGMMYSLQKYADVTASWAFVYSFVTAILVTRTLHTISGIWTGTFRGDHHYVAKPEAEAPTDPDTVPVAQPREQAAREHEAV